MTEDPLHVVVVVLGDLGRSPRMQYHVTSLLDAGHFVSFVGYTGEALIPALQQHKHGEQLTVVRFPAPKFRFLKWTVTPLYFLWRIVSLTALLTAALFLSVTRKPVDCLLVQNPPAVPLLAVAAVYCWTNSAALVIDWHNLGYSMISYYYSGRIFRRLAQLYERHLAPAADGHLTVTRCLKDFLTTDMGITTDNVSVLYDCPPVHFRLRTLKEQHAVLQSLDRQLCAACPRSWYASRNNDDDDLRQTLFTEEYDKGRYRPVHGRPALIVSSTSWTPDEDMSLLIDALVQVDQQITSQGSSLRILCAITGKGPLKQHYQERISQLTLQHVVITTLWIEPDQFPAFLACADLGVSLHTSSSGKDLPIKIHDYFGCEVPVCAFKFPCLHELVQDDVNGRTFQTSDELSALLWDLLEPLTTANPAAAGNHDFGALQRYSRQVQGRLLWSENWPKNAWPVIEKAVEKKRQSIIAA